MARLTETDVDDDLCERFMELVKSMCKPAYQNKSIAPDSFLQLVKQRISGFNNYNQQDSQEFQRKFLEELNRTLRNKDLMISKKILKTGSLAELSYDFFIKSRKKENSIITDVFYGQFAICFTCARCNRKQYHFESFSEIPLQFVSGVRTKLRIEKLIEKYFSDEYLDFLEKCEGCGKVGKHEKKMRLAILPKVLVVTLMRIDVYTGLKNEANVQYEETLEMEPYVAKKCFDSMFLKRQRNLQAN